MASLPSLSTVGEEVEQFRGLRSHLFLQRLQRNLKCVLISSGMAAEGKSFVAANLAMTLARNKEGRALLIDADMRRSSLHLTLGAPRSPGLAEYLRAEAELPQILQRHSSAIVQDEQQRTLANLTFIPAGDAGDDAAELISSGRMEELTARASAHFDWIIIDAPPVLAVADAVDLARAADGVLLVARQALTPYDVAQQAYEAFTTGKVLGFVLNAVKEKVSGRYYESYYRKEAGDREAHKQKGLRQ